MGPVPKSASRNKTKKVTIHAIAQPAYVRLSSYLLDFFATPPNTRARTSDKIAKPTNQIDVVFFDNVSASISHNTLLQKFSGKYIISDYKHFPFRNTGSNAI